MIYPRESETREVKDLSVIWKFKVDRYGEGYEKNGTPGHYQINYEMMAWN